MLSLRDVVRNGAGKVTRAPESSLTYWDVGEQTLKPNPYRRVSDTDARMLLDLRTEHALGFEPTQKQTAATDEAEINIVRLAFIQNWIEVWDTATELIEQLRSGEWNELRTDWLRTPTLGHLDCLAALIYMIRNVSRHLNPFPPESLTWDRSEMHIPKEERPTDVVMDFIRTKQFRQSQNERRWRG
jgi:hypothetical protein